MKQGPITLHTAAEGSGEKAPALIADQGVELVPRELAEVDWDTYAVRQAAIDLAIAKGGDEVAQVITELAKSDPRVGVLLNNLHGTYIAGQLPQRLMARMAVLSSTRVMADLSRATLTKAVATGANFDGSNLTGANLTDFVAPKSSFVGANLTGARMMNGIYTGADFEGANLNGADLSGAYLVGAKGLTPEQLSGAQIHGARILRSYGEPDAPHTLSDQLSSRFGAEAAHSLAELKNVERITPVDGKTAVNRLLTEADFAGQLLYKLIANGADLTSSRFTGAVFDQLEGAKIILRAARMSGALVLNSVMDGADLFVAWLAGSYIQDTSMVGANLTGANLAGCVFDNVDLTDAVGLGEANTNGVIITGGTILPGGFAVDGSHLVLEKKPDHRELPAGE